MIENGEYTGGEAHRMVREILQEFPNVLAVADNVIDYFDDRIRLAINNAACSANFHIDAETAYIELGPGRYQQPLALTHELLHANLYIKRFPRLRTHPFGANVTPVHVELNNLVQHVLMFDEWRHLGLDPEQFVERRSISDEECEKWRRNTGGAST